MFSYSIFETRLGLCGIVGRDNRLVEVVLPGYEREEIVDYLRLKYKGDENNPLFLKELERDIKGYFEGERIGFAHIHIDLSGSTPFQKEVYMITRSIPYAEVRTYGWIVNRLNLSNAQRAVGGALARNPIPLIIPCHRVIRKDGKLGGFSAPGGIKLKIEMLKLERSIIVI
ncbi:MAG: methylated-DNA--[protein]-cysteine S-methyltransferase [Nitrospinae bacterium]|nr:methylated-DNA--[protein]-cysteine S-methyltransferase [Nitrospinota bacterium]